MQPNMFLCLTVLLCCHCVFGYAQNEEFKEEEFSVESFHENGQGQIIKAKVSLYMESLCPGCHYFMYLQLFPVFMKYAKFIQLDLLPYGNANHFQVSNGSYIFRCQHGPVECFGNLYLACATHILQPNRPKHLIKYYRCMASTSANTIKRDVKICAKYAGVNFHRLEKCTRTEGPKILANFGDRTKNLVGMKYVPTIVINDEFKINDQDEISSDLFGYLCKKFKGAKPDECKSRKSEKKDEYSNENNLAEKCVA